MAAHCQKAKIMNQAEEIRRRKAALIEHLEALFDGIGADLAPKLAAESDPEKLAQIMNTEIHRRLSAVVEFRELEQSEKGPDEISKRS
jgi:hypothetical protein